MSSSFRETLQKQALYLGGIDEGIRVLMAEFKALEQSNPSYRLGICNGIDRLVNASDEQSVVLNRIAGYMYENNKTNNAALVIMNDLVSRVCVLEDRVRDYQTDRDARQASSGVSPDSAKKNRPEK